MATRVEEDPFAHIGVTTEEDPFSHIGVISPAGKEVARQAIDVAKQVPTGLVTGTEAIATFPAQAAGIAGGLVQRVLPEWMQNAPLARAIGVDPNAISRFFFPTEPGGGLSAAEQQAQLREATAKQREGIAAYLPQPETRLGQVARAGAEFIPSVVGGARTLSLPRAAGVGATTGVVSDVAGQATEGTPYELPARLGGAIVGGTAAARQAEAAAARSALDTFKKEIGPEASALYDQFRASGFQLSPQAAPTFSQSLKTALDRQGLTTVTADQTHRALDGFVAKPWTTPQEFQSAYKELGSIARKAKDGEERLAANIAQENLLGFLENVPPQLVTQHGVMAAGPAGVTTSTAGAAALLQEANANWAAKMRAENVSGRIVKSEQKASGQYSGLGLENELRRRIGVLGLPTEQGGMRGATEAERQAFQQFGEGTTAQNIRRYLTGALGGRGGFAVGGLGAGGLATYLGTGDPISSAAMGIGAPAVGLTLAMLGNRSALSRARDIERGLLARAPLAAGRIPRAQPTLPLTAAAPTLATIGELQYTPEGYPYYQTR